MSRVTPRLPPDRERPELPEPPPPAATAPGLGWRLALALWVVGFGGLLALDLLTQLWRLIRR